MFFVTNERKWKWKYNVNENLPHESLSSSFYLKTTYTVYHDCLSTQWEDPVGYVLMFTFNISVSHYLLYTLYRKCTYQFVSYSSPKCYHMSKDRFYLTGAEPVHDGTAAIQVIQVHSHLARNLSTPDSQCCSQMTSHIHSCMEGIVFTDAPPDIYIKGYTLFTGPKSSSGTLTWLTWDLEEQDWTWPSLCLYICRSCGTLVNCIKNILFIIQDECNVN